LTKIGWAKLWTIFSQTHLVTLSEGEMTMVTPVTHSLRHFLRIKKRGLGITGPHWKKVLFKWPRLQRPFTDLILLALMRLSGSLAFGLFIAFLGCVRIIIFWRHLNVSSQVRFQLYFRVARFFFVQHTKMGKK
jgi:hypothetical protein